VSHKQQLPSPLTNLTADETGDEYRETTATPGLQDVTPRKTDEPSHSQSRFSSPPQDTQPLSQLVDRHPSLSDEVEDEKKEGVWGYLVPLDPKYGEKPYVLRKQSACPMPDSIAAAAEKTPVQEKEMPSTLRDEEAYERTKIKGVSAGGYLIGRHPECGKYNVQVISPPKIYKIPNE
jgi:serine/threonine-protein kinase Chk2